MITIENDRVLVEIDVEGRRDLEKYYMTEDQFLAIEWLIDRYDLEDFIMVSKTSNKKTETIPNTSTIKRDVTLTTTNNKPNFIL